MACGEVVGGMRGVVLWEWVSVWELLWCGSE